MSDLQNQIPSFDKVMGKDTLNGKIPSFEDVMGEPISKKKVSLGSAGASVETGTQAGSSAGQSEKPKTVLEYVSSITSPEQKSYAKPKAVTQVTSFKKNERPFDQTKEEAVTQITEKVKGVAVSDDPVGKIESDVKKGSTNDAMQYQIVRNQIEDDLSNVPTARKWLFQEGKEFNPENKTDQFAKKSIEDYERVKGLVVDNGGDFAKAATQYYAKDDKRLQNLVNAGQLPDPATQGELVYKFLQDKKVRQLANESQDFKNLYKEQETNLKQNYPALWTNILVQKIAQGREDYGFNNPFLNLAGANSADKVIEKLYEDGEIDRFDVEHYQKGVRPLIELHAKKTPTPGFLENVFQSATKGIEDIPKGVYDLTGISNMLNTKAEKSYQSLEEDANQVGIIPKGLAHKVSYATGNLTGVLLPMMGGAKALQATNILRDANAANQLMMGVQFYHDLYKDAERENPNGGYLNQLQATIQAAVFAKINPLLGNLSKGIVKEAAPEIKSILSKLESENISGAAAKEEITKSLLSKIGDKLAKGGEISTDALKIGGEMSLATGLNDVIGGVFSGKFDADKTAQNMAHTFESMVLGTPLLSMMKVGGNKDVTRDIIDEISNNPEYFKAQIEKTAAADPEFAKQAPQLLQNLEHLMSIKESLNENVDLTPEQKKKVQLIELHKKILDDKIKSSPADALVRKENKERQALDIEEEMILDPEMGNKKFVEEMYNEELLPKGSRMLLEDADGKFAPNKVGAYLKFIAQQSNGLNEEWKPVGDQKPSMDEVPEQIIEAANERWKKEIEAAQPKEEIVTPQVKPEELSPEGNAIPTEEVADLAGNEKGVTLGEDGKEAQNIPAKENQGTSNSTRSSREESPENLSKRYKRVTDENDFVDPYDRAVKYFADGGRINPSELERIFGGKGDKGARISLMKNDAGTVKQIAHHLWETDASGKYEDTHYIDAVESALRDFSSKSAMQKDIADRYDLQGAYENYMEKTHGKEAIDIVEKMSEDEINHLLQLDAEKQPEFIDEVILKNETTQASNKGNEPIPSKEELPPETAPNQNSSAAGGEPPKGEEVIEDGNDGKIRLSHADTEEIYKEAGLPERLTTPTKKNADLELQAEQMIKDGYNFNEVADKVMKGEYNFEDVDQVAFAKRVGALKAKQEGLDIKSEEFTKLQDEIEKLSRASDVAGTITGRALQSRKAFVPKDESLADYVMVEKELNKDAPLTDKQKETVQKEYQDIQKAKKDFDEYMAQKQAAFAAEQAAAAVKKTKPTVKKDRKDYAAERKEIFESIKEKLKKARQDTSVTVLPYAKELFAIAPDVAKLVKNLLGDGITKLEDIAKEVKSILKEGIPQITDKDVNDLIAGEYNEKKATRNELAAKAFDLRRQAQLINKLDALLKGEEPKTEARKIRRNQEIENLKKQIKDIEDFDKDVAAQKDAKLTVDAKSGKDTENKLGKAEKELDAAEAKAAKQKAIEEERDRKRKEAEEERERKMKLAAAEKERKQLEREFEKEQRAAEKAAIKAKVEEAKRIEKELSFRTPEERALDAFKTRTKKELEKVEAQLKSGDFSKPEKKELKLDKEGQDLKDKLIKAKQERELRIMKQEYANRSGWEKKKQGALEVLNVPRTIMSSMDYSAPLRQGLWAGISHPRTMALAGLEMFKQSVSQKRFDRWFHDLRESPRFKTMEESELYVSDPHDPRLSAKEEAFMNNLAEKIPFVGKLIKGSERAYIGFLNKMRVDLFNRFADRYEEQGRTVENSPELYKRMADYINNSTGRGKLGPLEDYAPVFNTMFFSPRLMASRINLLTNPFNPNFYRKVPKEIRMMYAKDLFKFLALGTSVLALAKMNGQQVEDDPRSTDFGKIRDKNSRWDIWGGFQPYVRVAAQLITGKSKSANTGTVQTLDGEGRFGKDRGDVTMSFLRGKLAPVPSMVVDFLKGKDAVGQDVTIGKEAESHLLPLLYSDLKEAVRDRGTSAFFTVGLPSIFGVGVNTYQPSSSVPKTFKIKDPDTFKERAGTKEEYDKYIQARTEKYDSIKKEYDNGNEEIWEDVNGKIHISKTTNDAEFDTWKDIKPSQLTPEQKKQYEAKIMAKAGKEAKNELFGEGQED